MVENSRRASSLMAAVAAGALVGGIVAALGGYAFYKRCFRGRSSVTPSSQPVGEHLQAAREPTSLASDVGCSSLQKRKPAVRSRGVAENEQEHKPHPRRSLLAQLDDEAHSTAKIPVEPSHFTSPSGGSQTTELKPISEPGSPVTEPQSLEVKPTDTQSLSTKPTDSTEPSDAKPAKSCAKPTDADGTKPADTTESQSKPTESQTVTVTPAVLGPQPVIPEPQNTPEEKPTAKQDAITPTTRGGVKLPPGAVPVFSLVSPSVTPITVKLPPGAVPVFSATPAKPAKPSTASGGVKLPPGAVSVIPPAITAPSQQLVKDANQSTTWKEAPPPVHPKPKSFTKREHTSANPSSLAPSFKTPSNAVQVLPIQQAPPAKRRKGSHDDREQGTVKSKGQPEASVPVSNGIHANGVLTNGTELVNGELETPISFDQPIRAPGLKVATRIKGPDRRLPTRR